MRTQERLVSTILVLVQNTDTRDTRDTRGQLATNLLTFLGWGCPLSIATATCLDNLKLCFWAQTGHWIPCEETKSLHTQRFAIFLGDYLSLWHPSCWYWTVWMHGWQNQCSLENLTSAKTDHLKRGRIAPGPEGRLLCQNLSVFIHKCLDVSTDCSLTEQRHIIWRPVCKWSSPMVEIFIWNAATVTFHGCIA